MQELGIEVQAERCVWLFRFLYVEGGRTLPESDARRFG